MQIIHNLSQFQPPWKCAVLTLGVFDGMHLGHRALISRTLEKAKETGAAPVLVTYHPHPDLVLGKRSEEHGTEIFTYEEKLGLLQSFPLNAAVFLEFTRQFAQMSAEDYLRRILVEGLRASCIVIGYDQCFGKDRQGDFAFLQRLQQKYGYTVERIDQVLYDGEVVSSSRVRRVIRSGDVLQARLLLTRPFYVTGTVVRGFQRGRTIGFPTANLDVPPAKVLPLNGVYLGWCERGGRFYRAMINIGYNPTFHNQLLSVEAHLLDFDEEIYGESIRLHFADRLREERKFDGIDALKEQLKQDREAAARLPERF